MKELTDEEWFSDNQRIMRKIAKFGNNITLFKLYKFEADNEYYIVGFGNNVQESFGCTEEFYHVLLPHFYIDNQEFKQDMYYFKNLFRKWKIGKLVS